MAISSKFLIEILNFSGNFRIPMLLYVKDLIFSAEFYRFAATVAWVPTYVFVLLSRGYRKFVNN